MKLSDLGSRNGTFVNRQRITNKVTLRPGDVIQLGPGGPELEFDLDPRPVVVHPTRLADLPRTPALTREATPPPPSSITPVFPPAPPKSGVGKETLERMLDQRGQKTRRALMIAAAVVDVILFAGAGAYALRSHPKYDGPLTAAEVHARKLDSVVFFEAGWKIVDIDSGHQLYHLAIPNKTKDKDGKESELVPNGPKVLPVFVPAGQQFEPMLCTDDGGGQNLPIGGQLSGSGFVVSSDGFILTNRHVAATWMTRYSFPYPVDSDLSLVIAWRISFASSRSGLFSLC